MTNLPSSLPPEIPDSASSVPPPSGEEEKPSPPIIPNTEGQPLIQPESQEEEEDMKGPPGKDSEDIPIQEGSIESVMELLQKGKKIQNLSLKRLNLQRKIFEQPVHFENCEFEDLNLTRTTFKNTAQFNRCKFQRLNAHQTTFEKYLIVSRCEFNYAAAFKKNHFKDGIRFIANRISCGISFNGSHFSPYSAASNKNPDANFSDNLYVSQAQVNFHECIFDGLVKHWGSVFEAWAEFKGTVFNDIADFRSVKFNEGVFFTGATFKKPAIFRGSVFELRTDFNECIFEDEVDFSKAKLRDFLYLQDVKWQGASPKAGFRFHNMLVERMIITRNALSGHLLSEKENNYMEAADEYAIIRTNFERINRYDDEDWAYLKQKQNQRRCLYKNSKNPWKKIRELGEWLILDLGCGYGTDPFRAIRSSLVVVCLFAILYFFTLQEILPQEQYQTVSSLPLVFKVAAAFNISLIVFTSGYADIKVVPEHWAGLFFPIEFMFGIVLIGLFVVSFSRKVIRS